MVFWEKAVEEGVKGRLKGKVSENTSSNKNADNAGGVCSRVVVEI